MSATQTKQVNTVLPDVAYQPSLCTVAEGGPKGWSQVAKCSEQIKVTAAFNHNPHLVEKLFPG